MKEKELRELEKKNPEHPGGHWCLQCGRGYPFPGHTHDCPLVGFSRVEEVVTEETTDIKVNKKAVKDEKAVDDKVGVEQ